MKKDACIFCRISRGELGVEPVRETENTFFFYDHQPKAKVHILGVPKRHWESLNDVPDDAGEVLAELMEGVKVVAREAGIADTGYRVITNVGEHAGQEVKHLHFHVLGGEPLRRMVCK